jgi:hypothetical protein
LYSLKDGELIENSKVHAPATSILNVINSVAILRWLSENSYFYSLLLNTAWETGKKILLSRSESEVRAEYVNPDMTVSQYKRDLTVKLIESMFRLCQQNSMHLVILDIPRPIPGKVGYFQSSIPDELVADFQDYSDALFLSEDLLGEYKSIAKFHRVHGHHHISEFTHLVLGLAAAKEIAKAQSDGIERGPSPTF